MDLAARIEAHLRKLAVEIGERPIGSPANAEAAAYIEDTYRGAGLSVERQEFACPSWTAGSARLGLAGEELPVAANPFSPPCDVVAPTIAAGTVAELNAAELAGRVVVLYGDLTQSQLGAKGAIYVSERDRRVIRLLEEGKPAALLTVTPRMDVASGLTEDWQLEIPSATVSARTGLALHAREGEAVHLELATSRADGVSANVVGRRDGHRQERLVLCAHYDTKFGTPGAFDNGGGVATLLALAELLGGRDAPLGLELVAFSAEEFGGLGDMEYLRRCEATLPQALACVNVDGAGQRLGANTVTTLSASDAFTAHVLALRERYTRIVPVEPWFASDHYTFYSRGVPSVALTSVGVNDLLHAPEDTPEWVSAEKLAEVASFVADLAASLQEREIAWARPSPA